MSDKFFFPLMLIVTISMVWLATLRTDDTCPQGSVGGANTDYVTIKIMGPQLNRFIPGQGLEMAACNPEADYVLALRATETSFPPSPDIGPHFRLGRDIERTVSNRKIRVTVRARASTETGAGVLEVNYFTGPGGDSGWQRFALTDAYQDHSFEYNVPQANEDQGVDFLGIRPIVGQNATELEIESITLLNLTLSNGAH